MICPHCEKDTPATLPYCQHCGMTVDLSFDKVEATFTAEASARAVRESDERCRAVLLGAAVALVAVLAAKWLLVPFVPAPPVVPAYVVTEPADVAAGSPIPKLPVEAPGLEVPR